jgi:inactivated superfamily I helicase
VHTYTVLMKNVTLSLEDKDLEEARRYARERGMSLNALIRQLIQRTARISSGNWLDDTFKLMDRARPKELKVKPWKREDLYDV